MPSSQSRQPWAHDPVMAYEQGTYHVFSTGPGILSMTSCDLIHWDVARRGILDNCFPAWLRDSVPGLGRDLWAPDILRYRGRWYLAYAASTFGKNTSAIGLLSTDHLEAGQSYSPYSSPWRDEGCIIASHEGRDNWNAIDPNLVVDGGGTPWLFFGSFWDGIQLLRLDTTLHAAPGARPVTVARRYARNATQLPANPTSPWAGANAIEAPFVFRHDGWYYLFVSHDYCCRGLKSDYHVVVGRSRDISGPYLDREGRRMDEGGGTLVIEGDKRLYEAVGHCSVYTMPVPMPNDSARSDTSVPTADFFVCHGYCIARQGQPVLIVKRLEWEGGWPKGITNLE